jgi:uncharacterized membrane protein YfcA
VSLLAALLALLVGLSLGLLGGGGSILTVPIFKYALGLGAKESIGMGLAVVSATSLFGALRHWRNGNLDPKGLLAFAPAAIVSTFLGARLARGIPGEFQFVLLGVVMLLAAWFMWRGTPAGWSAPAEGRHPLAIIGTGVGVGLLTGVVGVGGGFLIVPALVLLLGLDIKRAVGTSLGVIALNGASGFVGYLGQIEIDWSLIALFTLCATIGVLVGAALVPKVPAQALKRGFACFLVLVATYILYTR